MPKRAKTAAPASAPRPLTLDAVLGAAEFFGKAFLAFCFCAGAVFYADGRPAAAAAYLAIGILLTPWAERRIARRWPEASRRRARETAVAVLLTLAAFLLGR